MSNNLPAVIKLNPFYMSDVEIIIPFHGEQNRVIKIVDSIIKTVQTNRFSITLVNDGSDKDCLEDLKKMGIRILHQKQKGFGAAVNLALKTPIHNIPWVLICHSDVIFEYNSWLSNLGQTMINLKEKGIKMVSPATNNPTCNTRELLSCKNEVREDKVIKNGFLPMYTALAHRELFNKVGLIKECPYAGTEVEEYAWRMNKMGFKQAVSGESWVNHIGRATLSKYDNNKKVQSIINQSKLKFQEQAEKIVTQA